MIFFVILCFFIFMLFGVFVENSYVLTNSNSSTYKKLYSQQKLFLILYIIIGTLICATRSIENTPDTAVYVNLFRKWTVNNISDFFNFGPDVEIGFEFLSKIIKLVIKNNAEIYLGIIAAITLTISVFAVWDLSIKRITTFFIFYCLFGFYYTFIVIRQGLALAIILFTLAKVYKNKNYKIVRFLIGVFIAYLFHKTAIISLFMIPFLRGKSYIRKNGLSIIFILSLILSFYKRSILIISDLVLLIGKKLFSGTNLILKLEIYFQNVNLTDNLSSYVVLAIFLFIIFCTSASKMTAYPQRSMLSIESIGILILGLLFGLSESLRFVDYFLLAQCYLLPEANDRIDKNSNLFIVILICALFIVWRMTILYRFNM